MAAELSQLKEMNAQLLETLRESLARESHEKAEKEQLIAKLNVAIANANPQQQAELRAVQGRLIQQVQDLTNGRAADIQRIQALEELALTLQKENVNLEEARKNAIFWGVIGAATCAGAGAAAALAWSRYKDKKK